MPAKYLIPDCLQRFRLVESSFQRWLDRKALAHVNRDRRRGIKGVNKAPYKQRIYAAVLEAGGLDYYTGLPLDWHLVSQWDNAEAARKKGAYKRKFWNLPTVDHENPRDPNSPLRLCSWRLNDAKNDQTIDELIELVDQVRVHRKAKSKP